MDKRISHILLLIFIAMTVIYFDYLLTTQLIIEPEITYKKDKQQHIIAPRSKIDINNAKLGKNQNRKYTRPNARSSKTKSQNQVTPIKSIIDIEYDKSRISSTRSNVGPHGKILAIFYQGCSGSTAVVNIAKQILYAHNIKTLKTPAQELDKPFKNPYYDQIKSDTNLDHEDILIQSYKMLHQQAMEEERVFLFKPSFESALAIHTKIKDEALFSGILRMNKLDRYICIIRDCFRSDYLGYLVDENGTQLECIKQGCLLSNSTCSNRRKQSDSDYKVFIKIKRLLRFIQNEIQQDKERVRNVSSIMYPSKMQFVEDLFRFEYSDDDNALERSVDSWVSLLQSFVVLPNRTLVKEVLDPMKNSRKLPLLHRDSIVNFDEVKKALEENDPPYDFYLRM